MKPTLLLLLLSMAAMQIHGQSQGPLSGTQFSVTAIAGSSATWTTTSGAGTSDDTYTTVGDIANTVDAYSDYLVIKGFAFTLPTGATIDGISVDIERSDPNLLTADHSVRIIKNAAICPSERATGMAYPATDAYQTYGGSDDLWGQTWSHKDIMNASFGVAIAAKRNAVGGTTAGRIDHVRITIHFTAPFVLLPVKLTSFAATKELGTVQVKWTTAEESNIEYYEVERSIDGRTYAPLGRVGSIQSTSPAVYRFSDNQPAKGSSWYRLKIVEQTGTAKYSIIVPIRLDETGENTLYPTLLYPGQTIYLTNPGNEKLKVRFFNSGGQVVWSTSTNSGHLASQSLLKTNGLYYYKIFDEKEVLKGSGSIMLQ